MIAAIVGGRLQGVEAVYLARKAGWEVILIDKEPGVPACGLCDSFVRADVSIAVELEELHKLLANVSIIIPATENFEALKSLYKWSEAVGIPMAFAPGAYKISSSKLDSDDLFAQLGLAAPRPWPHCQFPVIAKPVTASGSKGVQLFYHRDQLEEKFGGNLSPEGWIIQEYIDGPSYSIEVVGTPGHYTPLQVTNLHMDDQYDCKGVSAPTDLDETDVKQFRDLSLKLAEHVRLRGVMDVEVVKHNEQLKILEIDARLPSQTPTVVYWSTGCNILQLTADCFLTNKYDYNDDGNNSKSFQPPNTDKARCVIYEHISVSPGSLDVCGERIMAEAGPLHLHRGFFGADEAITNYDPDKAHWVATLIITDNTFVETWDKRNQVINNILKRT